MNHLQTLGVLDAGRKATGQIGCDVMTAETDGIPEIAVGFPPETVNNGEMRPSPHVGE